jgi:hypothetical protein
MHGIETAIITPETAPEGGARIRERWHGQRKRVTAQHNTTLSAIGVMLDQDRDILMSIYHNWHAKNPIGRHRLLLPGVAHFELEHAPDEGFPEWKRRT